MRRRKALRLRSSAGQVGSQGVRKSRLSSRSAAHSPWSVACGVRRTMPSPMTDGAGSEKLMERKNAIGRTQRQSPSPLIPAKPGFRQAQKIAPPGGDERASDRSSPSCSLAGESLGNGGGTFKPGAEPDHGDGRLAAADKRPAGGARALDRHRFDLGDQFVERDGPAYAIICRASWPMRSPELSSAISKPAFICALERAISVSEMVSAALAISSTTSCISCAVSPASVPAYSPNMPTSE